MVFLGVLLHVANSRLDIVDCLGIAVGRRQSVIDRKPRKTGLIQNAEQGPDKRGGTVACCPSSPVNQHDSGKRTPTRRDVRVQVKADALGMRILNGRDDHVSVIGVGVGSDHHKRDS